MTTRREWWNRDRILGWSAVFAVLQLGLLAFIAMWQFGVFHAVEKTTPSDFISFYAAGKLVWAGTPELAYDQATHWLVQQRETSFGAQYQFFYYPPIFLPLCAAFALLPYHLSQALFELGTLALFLFALRAILRPAGRFWWVPVLAFPPLFWNFGLGQNAFLTGALLAGFTVALDRRPATAGALLGLMAYKPHYGLLAPIALAGAGRWRAFAAAAATVAALVGATALAFGPETWAAYLQAAAGSGRVYESGRIDIAGMVTVFGALRLAGVPPSPAWAAQAVAALAMAGIVLAVWRRASGPAARSAALVAATLLAVPLALIYDQTLLMVAIAWLVRDGVENGFRAGEKWAIAALYPASFALWVVGTDLHVPLGPAMHLAVLGLAARRVLATRSRAAPGAAPARG